MTQTESSLKEQYELVVKAQKQVMKSALELVDGLPEIDWALGDDGWPNLVIKLSNRLGEIADDLHQRRVNLLLSDNG